MAKVEYEITAKDTSRNAVDSAEKNAKHLKTSLQNLGNQIASTGRTMTFGLTLPITAFGTTVVKTFGDVQESMSQMVGLVGIAKNQVNAWQSQLLQLAPALGETPKALSQAMFFITSAGLRGKEAMDTLVASAKAAKAGLGDVSTVADAATSALNAYGPQNLSAATATDVLVATVREGKVAADQLAGSIGTVIPLASQMGVSFNEVGAIIASLTRLGMNADEAVTSLQAVMSGLLNPGAQAEKALQAVGLSSAGLREEIKQKGLLDALTTMSNAFNGNVAEMAQVIPNVRALRGALGLLGANAETTRGIMARMKDVTGATDTAFKAVADDVKFNLSQALAQVQASFVKLGQALAPVVIPMVNKLANAISHIVDWFTSLNPAIQKWITIIVAAVAAIGPLLIAFGGIIKMFALIKTAVMGLGPVLQAAMNPWVLLGVAIAVIVTSAFFIIKNGWDKISQATVELGQSIKTIWDGITQGIGGIVRGFVQILRGYFNDGLSRVATLFTDFGSKLMQSASIIFDPRKWGKGGLAEIWSGGISDALSAGFKSAGQAMAEKGKQLVETSKDLIVNSWKSGTTDMATAFSDLWDGVKSGAVKTFDDLKGFFTKFFSSTKSGLDSLSSTAKNVATTVTTAGPNTYAPNAHNMAGPSYAGTYGSAAQGPVGTNTTTSLPAGLGSIFSSLGQAVGGFAGEMLNAAASMDPLTIAMAALKPYLQALAQTIGPALNKMLEPLVGILSIWGQVMGQTLLPVINALTPIMEKLAGGFVWLYNHVLIYFANGMIAVMNLISWAITGVANAFIGIANFFIGIVGGNKIGYLQGPSSPTQGFLQPISYSAPTDAGSQYNNSGSSSSGAGASYTQARPITVNMYVQNNKIYGGGGEQQFVLDLVNEMKKLSVLGIT